jgi:putative transposase
MRTEVIAQRRAAYPSDVTDEEWAVLEPYIPKAKCNKKGGGRPEKYTKREIVNAVLHVVSSGCRWSDMPHDLPPGGIAWHYFNKWSRIRRWKRINTILRKRVRISRERTADPSVAIIDSQTTKGVDITEDSGYDAGKKVKGRKRHLLTDTQGLVLNAVVHSAGIQDRDGAKVLLRRTRAVLETIEKIYADGGYAGSLVEWVQKTFDITLEIVKRSDLARFVVLPKRWIIERTNAWVSKARRLAKEYERKARNQESMIYVRMIQLMLKWVI